MHVMASSSTVPSFITKLRKLVDDPVTNDVISWNATGTSFHVYDTVTLARAYLPNYFRHNNYSSFVRQLNMYGFHKVNRYDTTGSSNLGFIEDYQFEHPLFHRDHPELMDGIQRRPNYPTTSMDSKFITYRPTPIASIRSGSIQHNSVPSQILARTDTSSAEKDPHMLGRIYNILSQMCERQQFQDKRVSQLENDRNAMKSEINVLRQRLDLHVNLTKNLMKVLLNNNPNLSKLGQQLYPLLLNATSDLSESQILSTDNIHHDSIVPIKSFNNSSSGSSQFLSLTEKPWPTVLKDGSSSQNGSNHHQVTVVQQRQPPPLVTVASKRPTVSHIYLDGPNAPKRVKLLRPMPTSGSAPVTQSTSNYYVQSPVSESGNCETTTTSEKAAKIQRCPSLSNIDLDAIFSDSNESGTGVVKLSQEVGSSTHPISQTSPIEQLITSVTSDLQSSESELGGLAQLLRSNSIDLDDVWHNEDDLPNFNLEDVPDWGVDLSDVQLNTPCNPNEIIGNEIVQFSTEQYPWANYSNMEETHLLEEEKDPFMTPSNSTPRSRMK